MSAIHPRSECGPGGERERVGMAPNVSPRRYRAKVLRLPSAPVRGWPERVGDMLGCSIRYAEALRERHRREAAALMLALPPVLRERYQAEMREALALVPQAGGLTDQLALDTLGELTDAVRHVAPLVGDETAAERAKAVRELEEAVAKGAELIRAIREATNG